MRSRENDVRRRPGVLVVAPGQGSQGGITTVINNYGKTSFWHEFDCVAFTSTTDNDSRWAKLFHDVGRWLRFASALLSRDRPSAVSIHTSHNASFYRKFAYLVVCAICRVPAVLHIHPASFVQFHRDGGFLRKIAIRIAGRYADQIVVLSDTIGEDLSGVFPPSKVLVLNNPVDIRAFSSEPAPKKNSRPTILFLGWIIKAKGVYDIVDAIPSVLSEFPDVVFTFAGNKEVDVLKDLLLHRGLEQSTEVLGWVGGQQKIDLLRTSWILALPSYTEGMPNVILEAMASRLPIVTTAVGGIPDVLENERTALFVAPGDAAGIAAALKRMLRESELRSSIASAAFQRACTFYSVDAVDLGLKNIYQRYQRAPGSF